MSKPLPRKTIHHCLSRSKGIYQCGQIAGWALAALLLGEARVLAKAPLSGREGQTPSSSTRTHPAQSVGTADTEQGQGTW